MTKLLFNTLFFLIIFYNPAQATETVAFLTASDDGYVREMPPGQTNSAAFVTLYNKTENTLKLSSIKSDSAEQVEFHQHIHRNGMMSMQQVPVIEIGSESSFSFAPGSFHIMLIGITTPLRAGDTVAFEVELDDGRKTTFNLPVKNTSGNS